MISRFLFVVLGCASLLGLTGCQAKSQWAIHDMTRPQPPVVAPGQGTSAPGDAVVLFDGTDLSQWEQASDGQPVRWKLVDGTLEVVKQTGDIHTKQGFGDCQLHIEWMAPPVVDPKLGGQSLSNSGVFLMSRYEVQVLNSHDDQTYADGQAAAVYGQNPPLVNASRPAGEWQSYDIVFHRPRFKSGKCVQPATVTVFHNGVLVQNHFEIQGPTRHKSTPRYLSHSDKEPLKLQDHGDPVRYRNIWVRPLE